jgi:transcriptional regulator with XRE-family HTH domain
MSERTYGAPLSKEMVRTLRERAGLSQEALATRLGLAGKAVVSGWETGRTTCEGPAAELLMSLFAANTTRSFVELNTRVDTIWRRAETWQDAWRQVSAIPEAPLSIDRETFAHLFPDVAIPSKQHLYGFPFIDVAEPNVFGIGAQGWSGSLPPDHDRAPRYLWQLERTGGFVYRELPWEEAYDSTTHGHTHAGALLELAACATMFLGRLAVVAKLDPQWRYALRLDLEGVRGRGVVAPANATSKGFEAPRMRSSERHLAATTTCTLREVIDQPVAITCALVSELLVLIRPELASRPLLERLLRSRVDLDRRRDQRMLGMLDPLLT